MASYDRWYRVGGSRTDFYATDEEIAEWLLENLPPNFAPYAIVGRQWSERERRWPSFEYPLADIREAFAERRGCNLWIRSDQLSPRVGGEDETSLSYGGLILVQLGSQRDDGAIEPASIAIVDRLRHETTGEERTQPQYRRIFDRLRRSLKKRLVVTTTRTNRGGVVHCGPRMTARAAEAHARGEVRFDAEPTGLRD
jgi:hypothetical protein